jgi:hypothetical protein
MRKNELEWKTGSSVLFNFVVIQYCPMCIYGFVISLYKMWIALNGLGEREDDPLPTMMFICFRERSYFPSILNPLMYTFRINFTIPMQSTEIFVLMFLLGVII